MEDNDEPAGEKISTQAQGEGTFGSYKRWPFDNLTHRTIVISSRFVTLIRSDSGTCELEFSGTTTANRFRGDVFMIATLIDGGGANFAQYTFPVVHAFCGVMAQFVKVGGVNPDDFNRAVSVSLTTDIPNIARC